MDVSQLALRRSPRYSDHGIKIGYGGTNLSAITTNRVGLQIPEIVQDVDAAQYDSGLVLKVFRSTMGDPGANRSRRMSLVRSSPSLEETGSVQIH